MEPWYIRAGVLLYVRSDPMTFSLSSLLSLLRSRRESAPRPVRQQGRAPDSPYHAVSVTAGHPSCEAAKQLATLRFLTGQAPSLPLPECNVRPCECRYSHYTDRRTGLDRRVKIGGSPPEGIGDRRCNHGRRAGDPIR